MVFLERKQDLIIIINGLKKKVNALTSQVKTEIEIRDTLIKTEQDLTKRLKGEIVRAKDVLMSTEMSIRAHQVFKQLVVLSDEERIFLDDGSIQDLLEREEINR